MYRVDERDRVVELQGIPQSSVGAPIPLVFASEHRVVLAYYVQETPTDWDGSSARMVDPGDSDEPIAIIRFDRCRAHLFGPPNDEAFSGHPLAARGLTPYSAFEISDASWIRTLERMNAVHPNHSAELFLAFRTLAQIEQRLSVERLGARDVRRAGRRELAKHGGGLRVVLERFLKRPRRGLGQREVGQRVREHQVLSLGVELLHRRDGFGLRGQGLVCVTRLAQ